MCLILLIGRRLFRRFTNAEGRTSIEDQLPAHRRWNTWSYIGPGEGKEAEPEECQAIHP